MRFSADWQEDAGNAVPEERVTVADLRLWLAEQNVTLHLDTSAVVDHVTVALYPIAEGIAYHWWQIFGGRDRYFSLLDARAGYVIPDLRMSFDGAVFEIAAHQKNYDRPDIRFWSGPVEIMGRAEAEAQLAAIVDEILARVAKKGITKTSAGLRWERVMRSRQDSEEAAFCEAAGALGHDPYDIPEQTADIIDQASAVFAGEPLTEFLAGSRTVDQARLLDWINQAERRPRYQTRLVDLRAIAHQVARSAPAREDEPAWARGYRRAQKLRQVLALQAGSAFTSYKALAQKLGGSTEFRLAGDVDGIAALRDDQPDGVRLHVRGSRVGGQNAAVSHLFRLARGVGDVVCFPEECRAPVNDLRDAYRQAAQRACAAEFLAPISEIRSMADSGRDIASIAEEFHVSPVVIERQIENRKRIEEACG